MDILRQIKERYPIELYLPYVETERTINILWDDNLPGEVRRRIEEEMGKMSISSENNADLELRIGMESVPDGEGICLALHCEEKSFYFVHGDACNSLVWTLYALVRNLPFMRDKTRAKILAVTYSAMQQSLASSILASVEYWQRSLSEGVLKPVIQNAIEGHAQELARLAPTYSSRPVTESGWNEIKRTMVLLPKRRQTSVQELSNCLFGEGDFEERLDAFCQLLVNRREFKDAVNSAVSSAAQSLCRFPLLNLEVRLRDAINEQKKELSAEIEIDVVKQALNKTVTVNKLSPEWIRKIFADADDIYAIIAKYKISILLLEALEKGLKEQYGQAVPKLLKTLQDWNKALHPFCKIGTVKKPLEIGWNCCEELPPECLYVKENEWDERMLYKLQTSENRSYYRETWFCSENVYEISRQNESMFINSMCPVYGLAEHLMVAFMTDIIQEQGTNG